MQKKKLLSLFIISALICSSMVSFVGCDKSGKTDTTKTTNPKHADSDTKNAKETDKDDGEETDDLKELEAIGDVDVDKKLLTVTVNLPKDFVEGKTQEDLDKTAKEEGYISATLNDDGSATYIMTKAKHKEFVQKTKESLDQSLKDMVGGESTPNITNVEANKDYTHFTVTTTNEEPDMGESFSVMTLYMVGAMYGIVNGEKVDNVQVDYVNEASGEIILTQNSKDMEDATDNQ